jgi:undecaprenyl-diphosphatase
MEYGLGDVVVLALIQGFTEFLPISSSGHLVLARWWLGISDTAGGAVDAFLHLGTLGAVLVFYRREIAGLFRACWQGKEGPERQLAWRLAIATLPAAAAGWWWQDYFESAGRQRLSLAAGFMATAAILFLVERWYRRVPRKQEHEISWIDAMVIGVAQACALLPSISRSAVTITAGLVRNFSPKQAVDFSLLLSIPIIAGASAMGLLRLTSGLVISWAQLAVGTVISFMSGFLAVTILVRVVQKGTLWPFALYTLLVGIAVWYAG